MRKNQSGFTLIELVVVIMILAILIAVALPRFISMQADARLAKMNGALAAVKTGAALAHSQLLVRGYPASYTGTPGFTIEGYLVAYVNGYPDADSIAAVSGVTIPDYVLPASTAGTQTIQADSTHLNCAFTYIEAQIDQQPTYAIGGMTLDNCG